MSKGNKIVLAGAVKLSVREVPDKVQGTCEGCMFALVDKCPPETKGCSARGVIYKLHRIVG